MKDIMRRASAYLAHPSAIRARIEPLMRRMSEVRLSAASLAKLFGVVFLVSLIIQFSSCKGDSDRHLNSLGIDAGRLKI